MTKLKENLPLIFPGSTSLLYSQHWMSQGDGGCDQSIASSLYCSFFLTLFLCSSLVFPLRLWPFWINPVQFGLSMGRGEIPAPSYNTSSLSTFSAFGVFSVSYSYLLIPPLTVCQFCHFLRCFPRGATILAEGLSCALWWVFWNWLEWVVFNMRQPLASPHRSHQCSIRCECLGTCTLYRHEGATPHKTTEKHDLTLPHPRKCCHGPLWSSHTGKGSLNMACRKIT